MLAIAIHYTLRDGTSGRLPVLARSTADAILAALDRWGDAVRTVHASPMRGRKDGAA